MAVLRCICLHLDMRHTFTNKHCNITAGSFFGLLINALPARPYHAEALACAWFCAMKMRSPINLADFNLSEALCRLLVSLDCAEGISCEAALRHQAICLSVRTLMNSQPKTMTAQSSNYRCQNGYNYASLLKVPLKKYPGLLLSSFVILLLIAHDNEFTRNRASELLGIWLVTA